MQADDAMRILGSAAAMGLLGGGGALAYNATSKPILDEYGNVIESNDINPVMAALGSAAIGAVGSGIYGKMNQPVAKPVQGVSVGTSPKPQQSPDIDIDVTPTWQEDIQKEIDVFRNEVANLRGQLLQKRNDYAQGVNDLREASIPIRQVVPASPMQMQNPMTPPGMRTVVIQPVKEPAQESADELMALQNLAGLQGNPSNLVNEYFDPSPNVRTFVQDVYSPEEKYLYSQIGQKQYQNPDKLPRLIQQPVRPGQEEFITTRRQVAGNAPGWNVVSADPEAAAYSKELGERQRPQNLQPVEPGQEMIEEALRLKELARRQAHFKGFDYPHNPEPWNYNQSSYSPSPSLHLVDGNPYDPNPEAFNSRKLLASQWNVYGPSSSQQAMESEKWLRKQGFPTYEDYLAQKKRA